MPGLYSLERHAPLSMEMCVLPSLSVAASVLPSYSRRGEYVLSLEATNYRSNGDDALGTQHLRIHKVGGSWDYSRFSPFFDPVCVELCFFLLYFVLIFLF